MEGTGKRISILGCGWYGMALAKNLLKNGFIVKGSTTTANKLTLLKDNGIIPYLVTFQKEEENFDPDFFNCDNLVICIPPKRSTAEQHTFLAKIEKIARAANAAHIRQIIFISSTSVYGDHNQEVNELTEPIPDTDSGKALLAAERMLRANPNFTTTILRFGGLIGPNRDPGRFFAGKSNIPNGKAPVNLIHLNDCLGITLSILQKGAFGHTFNACAVEHPSRASFYTNAAVKSGFEKPDFIHELLNWKLVTSTIIPKQLDYNFQFSLNSVVIQ